jgi:hypothetical protein
VTAMQYISRWLIERELSGCCTSVKGEAAPSGLLLLLLLLLHTFVRSGGEAVHQQLVDQA